MPAIFNDARLFELAGYQSHRRPPDPEHLRQELLGLMEGRSTPPSAEPEPKAGRCNKAASVRCPTRNLSLLRRLAAWYSFKRPPRLRSMTVLRILVVEDERSFPSLFTRLKLSACCRLSQTNPSLPWLILICREVASTGRRSAFSIAGSPALSMRNRGGARLARAFGEVADPGWCPAYCCSINRSWSWAARS